MAAAISLRTSLTGYVAGGAGTAYFEESVSRRSGPLRYSRGMRRFKPRFCPIRWPQVIHRVTSIDGASHILILFDGESSLRIDLPRQQSPGTSSEPAWERLLCKVAIHAGKSLSALDIKGAVGHDHGVAALLLWRSSSSTRGSGQRWTCRFGPGAGQRWT
jgi:hypothetical protein